MCDHGWSWRIRGRRRFVGGYAREGGETVIVVLDGASLVITCAVFVMVSLDTHARFGDEVCLIFTLRKQFFYRTLSISQSFCISDIKAVYFPHEPVSSV